MLYTTYFTTFFIDSVVMRYMYLQANTKKRIACFTIKLYCAYNGNIFYEYNFSFLSLIIYYVQDI